MLARSEQQPNTDCRMVTQLMLISSLNMQLAAAEPSDVLCLKDEGPQLSQQGGELMHHMGLVPDVYARGLFCEQFVRAFVGRCITSEQCCKQFVLVTIPRFYLCMR